MKKIILALALVLAFSAPAFADFAKGKSAYDQKQWKIAIENLRPAAESGDDNAMVILGNMYADGLGVGKDPKEAFTLYHRAAVKNNAAGMAATAAFYQRGLGVPVNTRMAIEWFHRSAKIGHQTGAFFYAVHSYQGSKGKDYDIPPDFARAYKWLRIAAKTGVNTKIQKASAQLADGLAKKMTPEELAKVSQEVADWKPLLPSELGPLPEDALAEEVTPAVETPATPESEVKP